MAAVLTPTTPTTPAAVPIAPAVVPAPVPTTATATTAAAAAPAVPSTNTAKAPEPQQLVPVTGSDTKINDLMLWYFVSAYAYSFAYLKTVANIQEVPDGHGIFNTTSTKLIGVLGAKEAAKVASGAASIGGGSTTSSTTSGKTPEEIEKQNLETLRRQFADMPEDTDLEKEPKKESEMN